MDSIVVLASERKIMWLFIWDRQIEIIKKKFFAHKKRFGTASRSVYQLDINRKGEIIPEVEIRDFRKVVMVEQV